MSRMKDYEIDKRREEDKAGLPKYPNISVRLSGKDGNAFNILSKIRIALRRAGVSEEEINQFTKEATSGDYNHLLLVCGEWINIT